MIPVQKILLGLPLFFLTFIFIALPAKAQTADVDPNQPQFVCEKSEADSGNPQACQLGGTNGHTYSRFIYADNSGRLYCQRSFCLDDTTLKPIVVRSQTPSPSPATPTTSSPTTSTGSNIGGFNVSDYKAPQHADYTLLNLEHGLFCEIAGKSFIDQKCVGLQPNGSIALLDKLPGGGAIGGLNSAMVALYTPPTSTAYYLAELGSSLGLAKPAYAQNVGGSGQAVVKPIYKLWQVIRNVSYVIFTLVFVFVGFMIMFRSKISQQTVISVQQALPGLVLGLILVTFSYFIASFIVDLSFVGMQLVGYLFQTSGLLNGSAALAQNANVFILLGSIVTGLNWGNFLGDFAALFRSSSLINTVAGAPAQALLGPAAIIEFFIPGFTQTIGSGVTSLLGGITGMLVSLIIIIAILIQMLRLLWGLVSAYISILAFTILGPLIILASSVPGKSGVLSFWWKTLLANVLIFPAVFAAILFGLAIVGNPAGFSATLPLFSGINIGVLKAIIGVGIILGLPAIPKMVKDALGVKDIAGIPQEAAAGAMTGFAAGQVVAKGGFDRLWRGGVERGEPAQGPLARLLRGGRRLRI